MSQRLLVERALELVPQLDDYLPLMNAIIGASTADREKLWARSGEYATISKRLIDPASLEAQIEEIAERARARLKELYRLVVRAIEEQQSGNTAAAVQTLVEAGEMEEAARWFEKAEPLYLLALGLAEQLKEKRPQVLALRRLGRVSRGAGRWEDAWARYQESYDLAVAIGDGEGNAIACQGLGNLCDDRGRRSEARVWYELGLEVALGLERPDLVWPFHTNMAALDIQDRALPAAEGRLERAREAIEQAGNNRALLYWYNNLGLLEQAKSDSIAAERVYRQALERAPDAFWEVRLRINLGESLVSQARHIEAEDEARRAEDLAIANRLIPFLVDVYVLLGSIARSERDEDGFVFYEQALKVCRERDLPLVQVARVLRDYGLLLEACGRTSEASAYLEQALTTYRELGLEAEQERVAGELAALAPPVGRAPA